MKGIDNQRFATLGKSLLLLLLAMLLAVGGAVAGDDEASYWDMDLESLMNIKVTTVSKRAQDLGFAPADITVITEKMIHERGYRDLKDVFRDLPGFDLSENVEGEVRTLVINRGILGNNKILVMLDGKKLNVTTGERFVYGNNLPLAGIERIEIIYGPSSAMYGADAYAGVVNMISKTNVEGGTVEHSFGSHNTYDGSFVYGGSVSDEVDYLVSFRYFNSDGLDPTDDFDDYTWYNNNIGEFSQPTKDYNLYTRINVGELTFGYYRMDAREPNGYSTNPGSGWFTMDDTYVWHQIINKLFVDHEYTNGNLTLTSSVEYSDYEVTNESNFHYQWGYQYKYATTTSLKMEEKASLELTDATNLSFGAVYERIKSFPKTSNLNAPFNSDVLQDDMTAWTVNGLVFGLPELAGDGYFRARHFDKFGVYGEITHRFMDDWQINAGLRYDKASNYTPEDNYDLINPRLGLIYNPDRLVLKALYGEAYIQPSEYDKWENFVAGNFLAHIPNPNLESENLRSYMLVAGYNVNTNIRLDASLFRNELDGIIRPVPYTDPNAFVDQIMTDPNAFVETNDNFGKQTTQGAEVKVNYVSETLQGYVGLSVLSGEEDNGDPISKLTPLKLHAGVTYTWNNMLSVSPRLRYYDKANAINPLTFQVEEDFIDSRMVLDLNLRANRVIDRLSLWVNVLNVLDEQMYAPSPFGEGPSGWIMAQAPQPGRFVQGGMTYEF